MRRHCQMWWWAQRRRDGAAATQKWWMWRQGNGNLSCAAVGQRRRVRRARQWQAQCAIASQQAATWRLWARLRDGSKCGVTSTVQYVSNRINYCALRNLNPVSCSVWYSRHSQFTFQNYHDDNNMQNVMFEGFEYATAQSLNGPLTTCFLETMQPKNKKNCCAAAHIPMTPCLMWICDAICELWIENHKSQVTDVLRFRVSSRFYQQLLLLHTIDVRLFVVKTPHFGESYLSFKRCLFWVKNFF